MVTRVIQNVNNFVWGFPIIFLLLGTHIFFTIQTGFIQKKIGTAVRLLRKNENGPTGTICPRRAFAAVFASATGMGNIIGIVSSILLGGPGAVLWCCIGGFLGMATKYAESLLSVKFRIKNKYGEIKGGPMYVMEYGMGKKWMGKWYAVVGVMTALGSGCALQVSAIATFIDTNVQAALIGTDNLFSKIAGNHPWTAKVMVGILMALLMMLVVLGGIKSIAGLCRIAYPMMMGIYIAACASVLVLNYRWLGEACAAILSSAFGNVKAVAGGMAGAGISAIFGYGALNAMISNEAGLGISGIIEAQSKSCNPVQQALLSCLGTFISTAVLCGLTGLTIVTVVLREGLAVEGMSEMGLITAVLSKAPYLGKTAFILASMVFIYTTILGWSYYGEKCAEYLLGYRIRGSYEILCAAVLAVASVFDIQKVRIFSDFFNAMLAIPNILCILWLSSLVKKETKKYLKFPDRKNLEILEKTEERESDMYI